MRSEVIAHKLPNHMIGKAWLDEAIKTHGTFVGYAASKDGVVIHSSIDPKTVELEKSINIVQTKYKDSHVFFHFTHADEGEFTPTSAQPFKLIEKGKDETLLAVMMDGDFIHYAKTGETPAQAFFNGYLREKVTEMYADFGNFDKTLTKLDSPSFRKDMQLHLEPRGMILFIPARGKAVALSNNNLKREYSWGLASKHLDVPSDIQTVPDSKPGVVDVVVVSGAKELSFAERQKRKKTLEAGTAVTAQAVVEPAKKEEAKPVVEKKTDTPPSPSKAFYEINGELWCKPPDGTSHKEAIIWWKRHTRMARPAKDDPPSLFAGFPVSNLAADSPLFMFLAEDKRPVDAQPSAFAEAMKAAKDKAKAEAKAKADTDNNPGLLVASEKQAIVEDRKNSKLWNCSVDEILNPPKSITPFSEQVQIPFNELMFANVGFWFRRGKRELVAALIEMRVNLVKEMKAAGTLQIPEKKEEAPPEIKPVEKPGEKTVEQPAVQKPMSFAERQAAKRAKAA